MKPFFIIGAQRSGTTLLRLMLNAHSELAIPEEGTFWMPLIRAGRGNYGKPIHGKLLESYASYLLKNRQLKKWNVSMEGALGRVLSKRAATLKDLMEALYLEYARHHGKAAWGDKTPSFFRKVTELHQIFPDARFIHLARDGRDVYLSMRGRAKGRKNVAVGAMEWKYKFMRVRKSLPGIPRENYFELRYEDVLADPAKRMNEICDFLGVRFEESMLEFWKTSHKHIDKQHSDLIFKPVTADSTQKWKTDLSQDEIRVFEHISGDLLEELGYEIVHKDRSAAGKSLAYMKLYAGLPRRGLQVLRTAVVLQLSSLLGLKTSAAGK